MYVDNITSDAMVLNYNGKAIQIKVYEDLLKEKDQEIERLSNIINELEKWLKENQILYGINQQGFSWGVCGEALDKLQELKGSELIMTSIVQKGNELWVNGKKIEQPKSLFFKNCVSQVNGKTYINGKELKYGKWKYTLRSIFHTLF